MKRKDIKEIIIRKQETEKKNDQKNKRIKR